jgi:hypothetical protein
MNENVTHVSSKLRPAVSNVHVLCMWHRRASVARCQLPVARNGTMVRLNVQNLSSTDNLHLERTAPDSRIKKMFQQNMCCKLNKCRCYHCNTSQTDQECYRR